MYTIIVWYDITSKTFRGFNTKTEISFRTFDSKTEISFDFRVVVMLAFSAGVWYYITMEKQKKWYNPLALAVTLLLVTYILGPIILYNTGDLSFELKVVTRVPTFIIGMICTGVAGAALAELNIRLKEKFK